MSHSGLNKREQLIVISSVGKEKFMKLNDEDVKQTEPTLALIHSYLKQYPFVFLVSSGSGLYLVTPSS
jgi:uncharacterized ion transporter superfamily protein YfcC